MDVKLMAKTQLTDSYLQSLIDDVFYYWEARALKDTQAVTFSAVRTCYSHLKPYDILNAEFQKYFLKKADDGGEGTDADRLIRHIVNSKHTSTLEHVSFTFTLSGISRALLAQLTRHRVGVSFSIQSQRYVRFGSEDKSGGFEYVTPPSVNEATANLDHPDYDIYNEMMWHIQQTYNKLRELGVPAEDARYLLPNAAATNGTMTMNLSALLTFYSKRQAGRGAQWEIAKLAEELRRLVCEEDPWLTEFFERV